MTAGRNGKRAQKRISLRRGLGALLAAGVACAFLVAGAQAGEAAKEATPVKLAEKALFVSPQGSDENPGTLERPLRTIQYAVERGVAGTTVYVREGVYDEGVRINDKYGNENRVFTLENYPGERPVIDRNYKRQFGIAIASRYAVVRGFEIRNLRAEAGHPWGMYAIGVLQPSYYVLIEGNTIRNVIGGDKAARGIRVDEKTHDVIIRNNTISGVVGHGESMGIHIDGAVGVVIRRNFISFCDKEGLRLITEETDKPSVIEENIVVHTHMGLSVNGGRSTKQDYVRNNFSGWNFGLGFITKHTRNMTVEHNTLVGNQRKGIDLHGNGTVPGDDYHITLKNNLLSRNRLTWWLNSKEVFNETVDYNFYDYAKGPLLALFNWSNADQCFSLKDIQEKTRGKSDVDGPYEAHGKEGDPRFRDPGKGDFRLADDSPAKGAADDGRDMGALEDKLVEVGADRRWGLGNIPNMGELKLALESVSSATEKGPAENAVDGAGDTYWELDTEKDPKREIVFDLPGEDLYRLTWITLVKFDGGDNVLTYYYKKFEVFADDGSGAWKAVPDPAGHPFVGFAYKYANGEAWALPEGVRARRVKVKIIDGYGPVLRIPAIRLYGEKVAPGA
ncbi:MAG: right-handed parallel beta-helix repeat-containing protein [Planctomycetota bacterium]